MTAAKKKGNGKSGCGIGTAMADLMIGDNMNVEMVTECIERIMDEMTKAQ